MAPRQRPKQSFLWYIFKGVSNSLEMYFANLSSSGSSLQEPQWRKSETTREIRP